MRATSIESFSPQETGFDGLGDGDVHRLQFVSIRPVLRCGSNDSWGSRG